MKNKNLKTCRNTGTFMIDLYRGEKHQMKIYKIYIKKNLICTVLYVAAAILTLLNIKKLYQFTIIFTVLAAMYYRQYQKQKATDEKVEKFLSVMGEKETDKKSNLKSNKSKRKEMKKKYEDFIAEIEDELGDFDEDELTEDEDGE